jgi:hypothetical protein
MLSQKGTISLPQNKKANPTKSSFRIQIVSLKIALWWTSNDLKHHLKVVQQYYQYDYQQWINSSIWSVAEFNKKNNSKMHWINKKEPLTNSFVILFKWRRYRNGLLVSLQFMEIKILASISSSVDFIFYESTISKF